MDKVYRAVHEYEARFGGSCQSCARNDEIVEAAPAVASPEAAPAAPAASAPAPAPAEAAPAASASDSAEEDDDASDETSESSTPGTPPHAAHILAAVTDPKTSPIPARINERQLIPDKLTIIIEQTTASEMAPISIQIERNVTDTSDDDNQLESVKSELESHYKMKFRKKKDKYKSSIPITSIPKSNAPYKTVKKDLKEWLEVYAYQVTISVSNPPGKRSHKITGIKREVSVQRSLPF